MKYRGLVVGLGKIGMGYDYNDLGKTFIASHTKALQLHPDFLLVGGVDPIPKLREKFTDKYNQKAYEDLSYALEYCKPEIVIVSTPIKIHSHTFEQLLNCSSLKLILCEKPIAETMDEAKSMLKKAKYKNISVAVNYIRRFDQGVQELLERIKSGKLGFPLHSYVSYRKGIINNGSHFLNLLTPILGEMQKINIITKGRLWDGWDPEPDLKIEFERGYSFFLSGHEEDFSYSQMEIFGPKGKALLNKDGRIFWWSKEQNSSFEGYEFLQLKPKEIPTDMKRYQYNVLQNISDYLSGCTPLICDGHSGLLTMEILDQIQKELS